MSRVISIIGNKGGQGRTNVTVNLAASLQKQGYKVLCVDLDAQSNLSSCFGIEVPEELPYTITNLIADYIANKPFVADGIVYKYGIGILPSTVHLNDYEYTLQGMMDGVYVFADLIEYYRQQFDFILIDCNSNTEGIYSISALAVSDECILPSQAQYLSSNNIQITLSIISRVKRKINRRLTVDGIALTMVQSHTNASKNAVSRVHEDYKDLVNIFDTCVNFSTLVSDSNEKGKPIVLLNPNAKVSIAYQSLAKEVAEYGNK